MVDMESQYHPPSPLEDSVLGSPLHPDEDFIGGMEELHDISHSINNSSLSPFGAPEYQSSSNGSEGSTVLGETLSLSWSHTVYSACSFTVQEQNVIGSHAFSSCSQSVPSSSV